MYRIETQLTGEAGTPYYMVGYFAATIGAADDAHKAWHAFVLRDASNSGGAYPSGVVIRTQPEIPLVNPVDGAVLEVQTTAARETVGSGSGPFLPPSNQILVRWRTGNYVNRREVRGRTNCPYPAEDISTTRGRVESGMVSLVNQWANTLITDASSNFVVWSKKNGEWQSVISGSTWDQFAVLRSRRD